MTPIRKKLIEISIPLEKINTASEREKDIKVGKHTSIHQWFAPRPVATCRAILFAQLVDDPSAWPELFPSEDDQDTERRRLHRIIEDLVPWESSNNESVLNSARWEIAQSVARGLNVVPPQKGDGAAILRFLQTKAPPVYDPFSGGGSIPLEAQRLGLRAYGSDLNPVAVLIGKALIEIPPLFAGLPPVNPSAQNELKRGHWNRKGSQGLADDVRFYGNWMRDEVQNRIGVLYPTVETNDNTAATVIAWIWARTVRSPDPAAKGAMVPLVGSFILASKPDRKVWVDVKLDPASKDGWHFDVNEGILAAPDETRLKFGTTAGKGQAFVCVLTGSAIDREYIQVEGKAGRIGQRLMAIVAEGNRRRVYVKPNEIHEAIAKLANDDPIVDEARSTFLAVPTPTRAMITGGVCSAYGLDTYGSLFSARQLVALNCLASLIQEVRERIIIDAEASGFPDDKRPLRDGGSGVISYADAISTYLAFAVDKNAQTLNSLVRWFPTGEKAQPAFEGQNMPMRWDYAEANVLAASTGSFSNCIKYLSNTLEKWGGISAGKIDARSAQTIDEIDKFVICTDPPYYDNIGYAVLSDFFYVWLRKMISDIWPDLFRRVAVQKDDELVATPYRHGGKAGAEEFFMSGMKTALRGIGRASLSEAPITIFYAFKQTEINVEGITSAGWASFLQAILDAGLGIDGTWPVRTEHTSKMISQGGANLLASSIVLVCRKREISAEIITRADFIRALKREMPSAIDKIRKAGVGPVDMQQSVIGPGMGVFSRYAKVLEDDDSAMPVKTALSLINRVWEEIDQELDAAFDAETQVALAWYATYGTEERASGELITLANAKNVPLDSMFAAGIFGDLRGRVVLMKHEKLATDWTPVGNNHLTVWGCLQHTARVLNAEDGGRDAASALVGQMGPIGNQILALAGRLFDIATKKGWSSEALVYNELAQEWPKLEDLAVAPRAALKAAPAQGVLAV